MKRTGFTLVEMMIALSISAFMLAAIVGTLSGVWLLVRNSASELQLVMRARYIRERLFYSLLDDSGSPLGYGLIGCTNIVFSSPSSLKYVYPGESEKSIDFVNDKRYSIDTSMNRENNYKYGGALPRNRQFYHYVYLKLEDGKAGRPGYAAYCDRLIVPIFGRSEMGGGCSTGEMKAEFEKAIGVKP